MKLLNDDLDINVRKLALDEFEIIRDLDNQHVLRMISKGRGLHCNEVGAMPVDYGVFEYAVNGELFELVEVAGGFEEPLARHFFG